MFTPEKSKTQTESLRRQLENDEALLGAIKIELANLEELAFLFDVDYEDGIYRFYHHSFKVYNLQALIERAVEIFERIAKSTNAELSWWFKQIIDEGTGKTWEPDHNSQWLRHTRSIVEAFLHAKYFLDMMIKYGRELDSPPSILPFGWAAILELYNQR